MRLPLLGLALLVACGGGGGDSQDAAPRPTLFGGTRPVEIKAPATLTPGKLYPLVLVLHGYGANGFAQAAYLQMSGLPAADQALVLAPDGTPNASGQQFWNADPACCDFGNQNPDDVAYLGGLIDEVSATWPVDPSAVFVIGHSNGGFMAYRLACERADVISAIGSLAGLASSNAASCTPSRPVAVLQLHGTADATVPYAATGSGIGAVGAEGSVVQWASHNGCGTARTAGTTLDLDSSVVGAETTPSVTTGCPAEGAVELWRMEGSGHIPILANGFGTTLFAWFQSHQRS